MNSEESTSENSSTSSSDNLTPTSESRYVIAQYAANPRRMETRNIGVILWTNGRAEARFVPDDEAADFVNDSATYKRWVSFWHKKVYGQSITLPGAAPVPIADPSFVDALLKTQKGNYLLYDAGSILEPVSHSDLDDAVSFLFDELVRTKKPGRGLPEHDSLEAIAQRAFEAAGVADREDFVAPYKTACKVFGVEQELTFHNAVGKDSTLAVFQRVPLRAQAAFGAATMFHSLVEEKKVRAKKRCAALVEIPSDEEAKMPLKIIRLLRRVSEVVDLSNSKEAAEQIREIAAAA